jgi:hypothetical protein
MACAVVAVLSLLLSLLLAAFHFSVVIVFLAEVQWPLLLGHASHWYWCCYTDARCQMPFQFVGLLMETSRLTIPPDHPN